MPHQLSGGQMQRVAIARAVAPDPAALAERIDRAHLAGELLDAASLPVPGIGSVAVSVPVSVPDGA